MKLYCRKFEVCRVDALHFVPLLSRRCRIASGLEDAVWRTKDVNGNVDLSFRALMN